LTLEIQPLAEKIKGKERKYSLMGSYEKDCSLWNSRRSQPLCRPLDTSFFIHPDASNGVEVCPPQAFS